jgi:hypothetical protein
MEPSCQVDVAMSKGVISPLNTHPLTPVSKSKWATGVGEASGNGAAARLNARIKNITLIQKQNTKRMLEEKDNASRFPRWEDGYFE